jgi:hypothetical protein
MKTKINLRISEISSIIGYNPYANIKPIILRMWKKANENDYYDTTLNLVQKNIIDNPFIRDEDVIIHHSKKYNINIKTQLKTCRTAKTSSELKNNTKNLMDTINNNKTISKQDKNTIQTSLHMLTKTNYGQYHEDSVITLYSEINNMKVGGQQKYLNKKIGMSYSYEWYITGRVDGIREDNILIEVKNRINRLFMVLKPYENVQIQIYLNLLKLKTAHLVECFKNDTETSINVIEVNYDVKLWKDIKLKIQLFIDFFYIFTKTDELKYLFLTGNDVKINQYYTNYLMSQLNIEN